jgi:nickel-dependent lactate racemase
LKFQLKYGENIVKFNVPKRNLDAILVPKKLSKVKNEAEAVLNALRNPIGAASLNEIVNPNDKIAIIFATGIHRKQTVEEKKSLLSAEIFGKVKVFENDARDPSTHQNIGVTSRGTPISIDGRAVSSNFMLAIANIDIHYFAGYGGGAKSVLPGIASEEAVQRNHSLLFQPGVQPGKADGNPVREDFEEAAKTAGLNFILNVVLNWKYEVTGVFAGDFVKAHRAGAAYLDKMCKVPVEGKADVVIASAGGFPKDINFYQSHKALNNAGYMVKKGGIIIFIAECREGLGSKIFENLIMKNPTPESIVEELEEKLRERKFVLGEHKAYFMAKLSEKAEIFLVSRLPSETVKKAFMEPYKTVDEALKEAYSRLGRDIRIVVMPHAGLTLPSDSKQK